MIDLLEISWSDGKKEVYKNIMLQPVYYYNCREKEYRLKYLKFEY